MLDYDYRHGDYHHSIEIGDRVKRHLVRHFTAFLKTGITERGFSADDPHLFDQDHIEDAAWDLAAKVIGEVQNRVGDTLDEVADMLDSSIADLFLESLHEVVPEIEREFMDDQLGGFDGLIALSSGNFPEIT